MDALLSSLPKRIRSELQLQGMHSLWNGVEEETSETFQNLKTHRAIDWRTDSMNSTKATRYFREAGK